MKARSWKQEAQDDYVAARVKEAEEAMRERCAKIAESCATKEDEDWDNNYGQAAHDVACEQIAAKIRSGE